MNLCDFFGRAGSLLIVLGTSAVDKFGGLGQLSMNDLASLALPHFCLHSNINLNI